jgi:hypothetical protein
MMREFPLNQKRKTGLFYGEGVSLKLNISPPITSQKLANKIGFFYYNINFLSQFQEATVFILYFGLEKIYHACMHVPVNHQVIVS